MRTRFLLYIASIVVASSSLAQLVKIESSLDTVQIKYLASYCKVWGFLKYYHPAVADGRIDWDSVFLEFYPRVRKSSDFAEFNSAITGMINKAENSRNDAEHINHSLDHYQETCTISFHWIDDPSYFNNKVISALKKIYADFKPEYNRYADYAFKDGNLDFSKDFEFFEPENLLPNESIRMLAIARFWNIINYFYPYMDGMGFSWDSALLKYIPLILSAKDTQTYLLSTGEFFKSIKDGHSYTSSEQNIFGISVLPLLLYDVEGKPVIIDGYDDESPTGDSILNALKISKGSVLLKINGKDADSLRKSYLKYVPGSHPVGRMRNATQYLLRGKLHEISTLTLDDGLKKYEVKVPHEKEPDHNVWKKTFRTEYKDLQGVWKILDGNIGYVNMGKVNQNQVFSMMSDLANTKAIIFDVRNYPRFTMRDIGRYLGEPIPFVTFAIPDLYKPGFFFRSNSVFIGGSKRYSGKIAILADEKTQSHAEFTVMSFQAFPGAKTFGSLTTGADGNISIVFLPGGLRTVFTGLGVYYPDGSPTQRVGIKIDYEVKPTIKGIREGKDEVLERAIRYINTGK